MNRRVSFVPILLLLAAALVLGCSREQTPATPERKLIVITTLFPLYDFARNVAGDRATTVLLLPPGSEPHSYEPRPSDMLAIEKADIFVYTGRYMEPWAASLLKGLQNINLLVVDASQGIRLRRDVTRDGPGRHGHESGSEMMDPHIWLDFANAMTMVDTITDACVRKDPDGAETYRRNGERYKAVLRALDHEFATALSQCRIRTLLHGGHFAFNYMAERYRLKYFSAYKGSPDSEPSARDLAAMTTIMKQQGLRYLFYEELISPRVAEAIAQETRAQLLKLHAGHNVTKEELQQNVSFVSLMKQNLTTLRKGLQCP